MLNVLAINPLKLVLQELVCSKVTRSRMTFKVLGTRGSATQTTKLSTCCRICHFLVGYRPQELANPKAPSVACCFPCWKHVIRSNTLNEASVMRHELTKMPP